MAATPRTVIFDSSGLVSLVKPDDQLHNRAVKVAEELARAGWRVLLPYEVLAESLNTIGKLVSKRSALTVGDAIIEQYAAQEIAFVQSEPHIVTRALQRLSKAPGSPSFIDCLVMACADEHQTVYIFGFDVTFKKNGYRLPEISKAAGPSEELRAAELLREVTPNKVGGQYNWGTDQGREKVDS